MTNAINFAEALASTAETGAFDRPPNPPIGDYVFQITKVPVIREQGDYDVIDFMCQAVEAGDNVDTDELSSFGALKNVTARHSFLFSREDDVARQRSFANIRNFLENHVKCWPDPENTTLKEALNNSVNQRFYATTRLRADKQNPENQYFEIDRTAPLE